MTLLILPLLESISAAGASDLSTADFLSENAGQLFSFALSFLLIAKFWLEHHHQYTEVTALTPALMSINIAWLATIVWLPVPTAMLGQMDTDSLQELVYIGTLILTQATTLSGRLYLLRHPELTTAAASRLRQGVAGDTAAIILFGAALALAVSLRDQSYLVLLLLLLTGPLAQLLSRLRRHPSAADPTAAR